MNIIEKTPGKKIKYVVEGNKITFGYDELTLNLKSRERDYETQLDICLDKDNCLSLGVSDKTLKYIAQVVVPERAYIEKTIPSEIEDGEEEKIIEAIEFNINRCTLILWGMEE